MPMPGASVMVLPRIVKPVGRYEDIFLDQHAPHHVMFATASAYREVSCKNTGPVFVELFK
jgi:hypothetical protein